MEKLSKEIMDEIKEDKIELMDEIKVDGKVIATYLDSHGDITGDDVIAVHCFCGRGEACEDFKKSAWAAGIYCEECEHFIEMTGAEADRIVHEVEGGEAVETDYSLGDNWLSLLLKKRNG